MTLVGVVAIALAVASGTLAVRADSAVARSLRALSARPRASTRVVSADLSTRVTSAIAGALAGGAFAMFVPFGALPVALFGYAGWVTPSLVAERRAARRARAAERGVVSVVEWVHALVSCGRPPDAAIAEVAARDVAVESLAGPLERVRRDYLLGVPMHVALAKEAAASGVAQLAELAATLEQSRDLGRSVLPLLLELRDDLRSRERARVLGDAAAVEGKLTAVMTLCYMPALALLVIVPLFVTLLAGLFAP